MSYLEAKRDGIPIKVDGHGNTRYYPPCQYCGEPVFSWGYRPGVRYTCRVCKERQHLKALENTLKSC